ncbi:MAG: PHB depolymerase family esterase [Polaromonas sp.]|nr:PHB depolymerase family esterase [Polaromonas sp.]
MTNLFKQTLLKATQLTRSGRLMDATRLIQQALSGTARAAANDAQVAAKEVIDVQARDVTPRAAPVRTAEPAEPFQPERSHVADFGKEPNSPRTAGRFMQDEFVFSGSTYSYRLFVPAVMPTEDGLPAAMPLVVLLHGCTQNALDFATGTAMNELANERGCLVLYPQQTAKGNAQLCWNWFEPGHQVAGRGEPGMIAALTRHILAQPAGHYQAGQPQGVADASRVYIAGLSAGGAMAAVVAGLYPDLYAAVGVHSGLPSGAAHDMMSAFKAMGRGASGTAAAALPTIVFHGSADKTVHPVNGDSISNAAAAAWGNAGVALVQSHDAPEVGQARRKSAQRTRYSDAHGTPFVEQWRVTSGPHAWSGGDKAGSYTDPDGPSASKAMLDFFLQHRKP